MSGASIEQTLELWAASLREGKARMRPLFTITMEGGFSRWRVFDEDEAE